MSRTGQAGLIVGAALSIAAGSATSVNALEVSRVQLGVVDLGGAACPRDAKVTAWAHTNGPGDVKFVIRNNSGGKTGELSAKAVKGATGNWLATYEHKFKIAADVDIKYMAEAVGHGKISNWVPFKATCGPQVRTKKTTAKSSGSKPKAKHVSEIDKDGKPAGKPIPSGEGKPAGGGKPVGEGKPVPASKPIGQCKPTLSVTRKLAVTRAGGLATARTAWHSTAVAQYGLPWAAWSNAQNQSSSCKRTGVTFSCTVSARPCKS